MTIVGFRKQKDFRNEKTLVLEVPLARKQPEFKLGIGDLK